MILIFRRTNMIISLDGLNGAGKSSIIRELKYYIDHSDFYAQYFSSVEVVKFPFDKNIYQAIENEDPDLRWKFAFDRRSYFQKFPLKPNTLLICDRYVLSNLAYCTDGSVKEIVELEDFEYNRLGIPKADLTFFIDVKPEVCLQRMLKREQPLRKNDRDLELQTRAYRIMKSYVIGVNTHSIRNDNIGSAGAYINMILANALKENANLRIF